MDADERNQTKPNRTGKRFSVLASKKRHGNTQRTSGEISERYGVSKYSKRNEGSTVRGSCIAQPNVADNVKQNLPNNNIIRPKGYLMANTTNNQTQHERKGDLPNTNLFAAHDHSPQRHGGRPKPRYHEITNNSTQTTLARGKPTDQKRTITKKSPRWNPTIKMGATFRSKDSPAASGNALT